ncbi:MAG: L,D-transpeptidase family protein [Eubacterium sp.]|nr:L,D-transpeptidase family protein [Eubacterium sp.]
MWDNKVKRIILIGLLSIAGLALLTYEYGTIMSYKNYYPFTRINNTDFSGKSVAYAEEKLYENASDVVVEVIFRDNTYQIRGNDIDLKYSYKDDLERIKSGQKAYMWPKTFSAKPYDIRKRITFNEAKLRAMLAGFDSMDKKKMKEPQNPTIELTDEGVVVAVDQDPGTVIASEEKVYELIQKAIYNEEKEVDIEAAGVYSVSEFNSESPKVQKCVDFCNSIVGMDINYQLADCTIPIEKSQIFEMIKITPTYETSVNKNRVRKLVERFALAHNTYENVREFKTHDHKRVMITNSHYGWYVDVDTETEQLFQDIIHRNNVEREPALTSRGYFYNKKGDDIGGTYCEVDLANQVMFFYKDYSQVLTSPVVTGNTGLGRGTPGGIYSIAYKQSPAVLKGDDYETKVTYWMPFNGGIGFHDATWRGSFGGNIYTYNGSHGCVNMPYYNAQTLFFEVDAGIPVIVY